MLPHRSAARALGASVRPRMVPGAGALYTRQSLSPSIPRPALASGPSSRRTFVAITEPLGNALLAIHSSTGLPWYLLIPALSVLQTALFNFPLHISATRIKQRRALMEPLMAAWNLKTRRAGLPDHAARAKVEIDRIHAETKTQTWRIVAPHFLINWPTFIIGGNILRYISNQGTPLDPSYATEGCLWFSNLAAPDPFHVLPVLVAVGFGYRSLPRSFQEARALFEPGMATGSLAYRRTLVLFTPVLINWIWSWSSGSLLYWLVGVGCHHLARRLAEWYIPHKVPPPQKDWYFENWKDDKKDDKKE